MAIVTLLNEEGGREGDRRSLDLDRLRYIIISESDDDECPLRVRPRASLAPCAARPLSDPMRQ